MIESMKMAAELTLAEYLHLRPLYRMGNMPRSELRTVSMYSDEVVAKLLDKRLIDVNDSQLLYPTNLGRSVFENFRILLGLNSI